MFLASEMEFGRVSSFPLWMHAAEGPSSENRLMPCSFGCRCCWSFRIMCFADQVDMSARWRASSRRQRAEQCGWVIGTHYIKILFSFFLHRVRAHVLVCVCACVSSNVLSPFSLRFAYSLERCKLVWTINAVGVAVLSLFVVVVIAGAFSFPSYHRRCCLCSRFFSRNSCAFTLITRYGIYQHIHTHAHTHSAAKCRAHSQMGAFYTVYISILFTNRMARNKLAIERWASKRFVKSVWASIVRTILTEYVQINWAEVIIRSVTSVRLMWMGNW